MFAEIRHSKVLIIQKNLESSKNELGSADASSRKNQSRIEGSKALQGNRRPAVKKSLKTTTSSGCDVGVSSDVGARPSPQGKKPFSSYSLISSGITRDLPKTRVVGYEDFGAISSSKFTSTFEMTSLPPEA
jgi:hypothetical protein